MIATTYRYEMAGVAASSRSQNRTVAPATAPDDLAPASSARAPAPAVPVS